MTTDYERRIEGYWRASLKPRNKEDNLPWPEPNAIEQPERDRILSLIKRVESRACRILYRGISLSRLTGECNGCAEYKYKGWVWPDGLKHYVEHGVKPSDDFIKFLEGIIENDPSTASDRPKSVIPRGTPHFRRYR